MKSIQVLIYLCLISGFFACETTQKNENSDDNVGGQAVVMNEDIKVQKSVAMEDANFLATWDAIIPKPGSKAPDFTLFSKEGQVFNLYEELKGGKPVLLVNGSYTCDLAQSSLQNLNQLFSKYSDKINFNLIYTVEAHPFDAVSPYSMDNKIWVKEQNQLNNIESKKPVKYSDRVKNAFLWDEKFNILPRILIDSPENTFWTTYGQSPNMVLLIKPNGEVYYRQMVFSGELLELKLIEFLGLG
ncbi:MAG: hypothetical protein KDC24_03085 [Saprospiraceae bacterium]|nr:hypothetical protein [Saprospiraceae bacterium]